MKNIFYILLLLPTIIFAQYPSNSGQKITLGEQTTADGLVWRGVLNDTALITPFSDTSAYIILDTVNNRFYNYKRNTNVWTQAGGSDTTSIAYVNTYGTQTVNGAKTFNNAVVGASFRPTSSTIPTNGIYLPNTNTLGFSTNSASRMLLDASGNLGLGVTPSAWGSNLRAYQFQNGGSIASNQFMQISFNNNSYSVPGVNDYYISNGFASRYIQYLGEHVWTSAPSGNANDPITFSTRMTLSQSGNLGIGTTTPQSGYRLHVVDSVYVGGRVSAAGYTTRSDYNLKDEIQTLNYGLNEVIQMQPVKYTYKSNGEQQLGFIAQDIGTLIPESVHFDEYMGVDYQSIIPILTKAIQEQQALIKALEQRILILENK